MLAIIRRRTQITTSPAPAPVDGVDVTPPPRRPVIAPVVPVAEVHYPQRPGPVEEASRSLDSSPAAAVPLARPASPPGWTPGRCYHPVHVDLDGHRYGLLPEPGDNPRRGSLLRCSHVNPDGR